MLLLEDNNTDFRFTKCLKLKNKAFNTFITPITELKIFQT